MLSIKFIVIFSDYLDQNIYNIIVGISLSKWKQKNQNYGQTT